MTAVLVRVGNDWLVECEDQEHADWLVEWLIGSCGFTKTMVAVVR